MKVLIVGATGAIGRRLVPRLLKRGHEVVGTCRSPEKIEQLLELGAEPVVLDALDALAVHEAVAYVQPEAIVHQATAHAGIRLDRDFDRAFALTNRLRTEGTDNLLIAARETGVTRFVAQSHAGMRTARDGRMVKNEGDSLDPDPPAKMRESQAAMCYLEQSVTDVGGTALRYGAFYGDANDAMVDPVRKRQFPIVGDGGGYSSWVHLEDAAQATVLALERDGPAIYNVTDDEPAPAREWLPALAKALGARPAAARARLACPTVRGSGPDPVGDRCPRRLERQGEAPSSAGPPCATRAGDKGSPRSMRNPVARPLRFRYARGRTSLARLDEPLVNDDHLQADQHDPEGQVREHRHRPPHAPEALDAREDNARHPEHG